MLLKSEIIFHPYARFYVRLDQTVLGFEHYEVEILVDGERKEVKAFSNMESASISYEATVSALKLRINQSIC